MADLNNKIIANNYFLKRDERIKLLIQKQEYYSSFCCTFKYAMVVSEPEFSEFNKYPKEYYDSGKTDLEEIYFENQNYIGKFNYYNICLNHSLTEIGCQNNCDLCEEMNPKICITCNNTYLYENNYKICQDKTIDNDSLYSMEININQSVKINSSNNEDGNDEHCNLKEIIKNNCFEDITSEMGREVYSYIKSNLINNNYTLIKTGNMIFQVSSFKIRANLGDISYIDLGECENLLKREYNISESEDLIIFQIDIKDLEKIKTYVQYEIYEPHEYHKLNLDICEDLTINIYSPVYLDNETALIYSSLNKEGYNLFNANDPFYNDICSPYTTLNGTDIILEDRKNDIYNKYGNISICQNNCIYEYYNETTKKVKCDCTAQIIESNINFSSTEFIKEEILDSFFDSIMNSNFQVLKCYKLLIKFKPFFKNIGRIIMSIIFLFLLILSILYFIIGKKKLKKFFDDIMALKIIGKKNINKNLFNYKLIQKSQNKNYKVSKNEVNLTNIFESNN